MKQNLHIKSLIATFSSPLIWKQLVRITRTLILLICFLLIASCSTISNQNKVINMDMNDPRGMYVKMLNFVLPVEINGVKMEKVYTEGSNGVVHTSVGDFQMPEKLNDYQTVIIQKMFEGMAKQEVCVDATKPLFEEGIYAKFIYRDKNTGSEVVVILDEEKCKDNKTETTELSGLEFVDPFQKRYVQCFAEPTLEEGKYRDVCLGIGQASYHFENENKVLIHWGAWNDMFYEDDSRAWFQQFENTEFNPDERSFRGSIVFDKRLKMYPDEVQWNFEMLFNEDYSEIIGGQVETVAEDGTVSVPMVYQPSDHSRADRVDDTWYVWYVLSPNG